MGLITQLRKDHPMRRLIKWVVLCLSLTLSRGFSSQLEKNPKGSHCPGGPVWSAPPSHCSLVNEIVCDRFQEHSRYSTNIDCCSLSISLDSRLLIFNSCWTVKGSREWQRLWGKIAHSFSLICPKKTVQRLPFSIYKTFSSRLLLHVMWKESKTTS